MSINKNQTISVIIPAYNAESTITAAVNSVLAQTHAVSLIVIINDGSTDNTEKICVNLAQEQQKKGGIPINILSQPNGGVAKARNYGIIHAKSEFIAFLDSDDAWIPTKIAKQLAVFEQNPNADLVCSASTVHKTAKKNIQKITKINFLTFLLKNPVVTSSVLLKKSILPNPTFNEQLRRSEDYNLWIKIAKNHTLYKINEELVEFSTKNPFGESGLSKNIHAFEIDELRNFADLFQKKIISLPFFFFASVFSVLKYLRRSIILFIKH